MPMTALAFPSNVSYSFSFIIDLANLKIFNMDKVIEKVTGIKNEGTQETSGYSGNLL